VRPTDLNFVPRVWDMLLQAFQGELERRSIEGADQRALQAEVMAELRQHQLGGRFVSAMTSSAPIPAELKAWVESFLDMHLVKVTAPPRTGPCWPTHAYAARQ
jgi:fatty acid CoA ligase FadD9